MRNTHDQDDQERDQEITAGVNLEWMVLGCMKSRVLIVKPTRSVCRPFHIRRLNLREKHAEVINNRTGSKKTLADSRIAFFKCA